jgi:hypothetical protein
MYNARDYFTTALTQRQSGRHARLAASVRRAAAVRAAVRAALVHILAFACMRTSLPTRILKSAHAFRVEVVLAA